ncbi:hypothetical protein JCM3770_004520 [Rhodotorula araucariae]
MRYLDDGVGRRHVALSSVASFVAVVFLSRLATGTPLQNRHNVLVAATGGTYLIFVCTGLIIAYARFLPPPTTRIWDLVRTITSYLAVLWTVCLCLSGTLLGEVLLPVMHCAQPYPALCVTLVRMRAIHVVAVLAVALAASLALCILVSVDLHATHPEARVVILRSELAAQRAQRRRIARYQAEMDALAGEPLLAGAGQGGSDDDLPGPGHAGTLAERREASRRATVRAFLARSKLPVDDPEAALLPSLLLARAPPSPTKPLRGVLPPARIKDALGAPAMFSPDKRRARGRSSQRGHSDDDGGKDAEHEHAHAHAHARHRHHRRHEEEEEEDKSDTDTDTSSSTGPGDDDDDTTETSMDKPRAHARAHGHHHAARPLKHVHHKHHHHDEDIDHEEEKERGRRKIRKDNAAAETTNFNATRMETASNDGSAGGGVQM